MERFKTFLDERPILNAKMAVPDSAPTLKKLANGVFGQKIKAMSSSERAELTTILQKLMDILHTK